MILIRKPARSVCGDANDVALAAAYRVRAALESSLVNSLARDGRESQSSSPSP